ncbi:hypothetical protein [Nocardia sp. SC052]|uniref:hypothetical protein n=1 Tax=Nocardia sichangensis TaxID=3385975 RepID=UPI00399F2B2F
MPAKTYLLRRDDDELGVHFRQEPWIGPQVRCMVPGCTWTHPDWDESAMQAHARDEWSGEWKHEQPPLTGYTGTHRGC